ncbi:secondary carrier transporter [Lithospermum erythrorhizon]|uniref:Secondary carrier transporter n=1 Tax=Lithospermum erythrorhizon TaxID=34254 RepID=A0AAV3NW12_LITER
MEQQGAPFKGIIKDINGRLPVYKTDWTAAYSSGMRILAPTSYIFFASAIPVIAFGEQLSRETDGSLGIVESLLSTAMCGIIHSIIGGQPLLIVGVAEPTIIMYSYLYHLTYKSSGLGKEMFVAWAGWVCVWTALMLFLLAIFNACTIISRFTRVACEMFGMLITVLFMQEAVKGVMSEFKAPKGEDNSSMDHDFQVSYMNGLMAIILSFGVLYTSLKSRNARSWRYGTGWFRGFIADYGVPLMVILWTALSFTIPKEIPSSVPRRLECPLPWEASIFHWKVAKDMVKVPVGYILAAFIPAVMIAGLYFFDHSVSAKMAQPKEFNLKNPPAYHYDLLILGFMTLICGLLGLPPSNGVIPQAPMHTRSLAVLQRQHIRKKMVKTAKKCMKQDATKSEIFGKMQDVFIEMDTSSFDEVDKELENLKEAVLKSGHEDPKNKVDIGKHIDIHLPVRVNEQRVSNLLQSVLVGLTVCAVPVIKMIPSSVLWGYFAYMALDNLPGNQFWDRFLLLFITPRRRFKVLEGVHMSFVDSVPFKHIATFTLLQFVYFLICYGMTWIPVFGILFPLPFFFLITIREYVLPRIFPSEHLRVLDAAEYEEVAGVSIHARERLLGDMDEDDHEDFPTEEIFDELVTHRGELRRRPTGFSDRQYPN